MFPHTTGKDPNVNRTEKLALTALTLALAGAFGAQAAEPIANSLTIYSSAQPGAISPEMYRNGGQHGAAIPGYAMVRHEREIDLKSGRNDVRFTDVAGMIDPTTVSFESLTDPKGTRVVEQNFQFDLVSTDKLLQKFIDKDITVEQARGEKLETFSGTLLSTAGGLVLREGDGSVRIVSHNSGVTLAQLARRPDHAPDTGVGCRGGEKPASTSRVWHIKPAGSPGGRTTT